MIINWNFVLDVALICCCTLLAVFLVIFLCVIIEDAVKKHKKRVDTLKQHTEKIKELESTVLWIRQDVDDAMLDIHHLEDEINEKGDKYENNRKNSHK